MEFQTKVESHYMKRLRKILGKIMLSEAERSYPANPTRSWMFPIFFFIDNSRDSSLAFIIEIKKSKSKRWLARKLMQQSVVVHSANKIQTYGRKTKNSNFVMYEATILSSLDPFGARELSGVKVGGRKN